jgi:hypothetical protein
MTRPTLVRALIAIGSMAIGLIHLRLYSTSYRDVPIENLGRSFLLNAVAAMAAALGVVFVAHRWAVLAPLVVANATLIAFGLSRTDRGIMGFTERGWNPTPDAALSVAVEIVTALLCIVALAIETPTTRALS